MRAHAGAAQACPAKVGQAPEDKKERPGVGVRRGPPAGNFSAPAASVSCGDILMVEQVDRLFRLTSDDWEALKAKLAQKRIRVVAVDLPTSWIMADKARDDFTGRLFDAINGMLLDMLAAIARKDYDDRRRRQAQRIAKAKTEGLYKGRVEDTERNAGIMGMLESGSSWNAIQAATGCSRSTIARLAKRGAA
jgi:DNA invertase Pin-like site-specific DNA recombinase